MEAKAVAAMVPKVRPPSDKDLPYIVQTQLEMGYLYIWTKLGNIIIAIHISCKLKLLVSMYIWTILGNIIAIHISCK